MKILKTLIILFFAATFTSCGSGDRMTKKKSGENKTADTNKDGSNTANVRLQISFISIGAGIDGDVKDKYDAFITAQTKK